MDANLITTQEKQPRLLLAILCAIGMGLIGCLLFGLLYYLGFIAWISGYVIVIAAAWGYKKFNLKLDVKGYIIIAVISVVEIVLTILITLNIVCMITLIDDGMKISFFKCFGLMMDLIANNADLKDIVIRDAVLAIVLVGVGLLTFYFVERKKQKDEKVAEQAKQDAAELQEVGTYKVVLTNAGTDLIKVISVIRATCGVDLKVAKEMAESAPTTLKENITREAAQKIADKINETGSTAEVE